MTDINIRIGKLESEIGSLSERLEKFNPYHDPSSGRFSSATGGMGSAISGPGRGRIAGSVAMFDKSHKQVSGHLKSLAKKHPESREAIGQIQSKLSRVKEHVHAGQFSKARPMLATIQRSIKGL